MNLNVAHGSLLSESTQSVISTAVAYPILFETAYDLAGTYREGGNIIISSASPCVVTATTPSTHIMVVGCAVRFSSLSDETKGVVSNTTYYVTSISGNTFKLASTIALARAVAPDINTTGSISGVYTCISRIYVRESGDYLFGVSGQLDSTGITGAIPQRMDIWFVQGNSTTDKVGAAVGKSNTQASTDRAGVQLIVAIPALSDLNAGDFIELNYHGDDTRLRWIYYPAVIASGLTPAIPLSPSVVLSINKICR